MTATIDIAELAKHNTKESCWVVIHGQVWDVTEQHPGGVGLLFKCAGRDGTASYDSAHNPELVSETLPPRSCLGTLDSSQPLPSVQEESNAEAAPAPSEGYPTPTYPPLSSIVNVGDFERVAEKYLSAAGWAYYSSGAEDELSLSEPRRIFSRIALRSRVMRCVEPVDTSCTILGYPSSLPIYITPTGLSRYAHKDGDRCLTRAAGKEGIVYCTPTSAPHEVVFGARVDERQPLFFQLYTGRDMEKAQNLIRKVERLGAAAIFLTVDSPVLGRRERDDRLKAAEGEDALTSAGVARTGSMSLLNPLLTWEDLKWVRATTKLPLVIKGIQTVEDAVLAHRHGVEGIVISNHGGRSQDTAQAPMLTLLEIRRHAPYLLSDEVKAKFQVFVDGGIRRGTDVLKALALGASAVGIGRPALYSMTNDYGEAGVLRLIKMFRLELQTNMALAGAASIKEIVPEMVNTERVEHEVSRRVKL